MFSFKTTKVADAKVKITNKTYSAKEKVAKEGSNGKSSVTVLTYTYVRPKFSGNKKVKNINKYFSNDYKSFTAKKNTLLSLAENNYKSSLLTSPYTLVGKWSKSYQSSSVVSYRFTCKSTTGTTDVTTTVKSVTFNIKTGKQLYVDDFVKGKKKNVINKILKAYNKYAKKHKNYTFWSTNKKTIKNTKIKDFPFYLSKKGAVYMAYSPNVLAPTAVGIIKFKV